MFFDLSAWSYLIGSGKTTDFTVLAAGIAAATGVLARA